MSASRGTDREPARRRGGLGNGTPLLGHAVRLLRDPTGFLTAAQQAGPVVPIRLGPRTAYLVSDAELIHRVLVTDVADYERGEQYDQARPMVGDGLVAARGEAHRRQRRILQPAFRSSLLASYAAVMREVARDRADAWQAGRPVRLDLEFNALALEIASRALFSVAADSDTVNDFQRSVPVLMRGIQRRTMTPVRALDRLPTPANRAFERALHRLHGAVDRIVHERTAEPDAHDDVLTVLLSARNPDTGEPLTERQVHDEAVSLLTAGSETVATTLSWTVHELGRHPGVQQRVQEEADRCPEGAEPLAGMPYTRQVVSEVLRRYPPLFLATRRPVVEVELGGLRLAPGSTVILSLYGLHHDPAVFADPAEFLPERWDEDNAPTLPRGAFLPFGNGPVRCIGEAFAMTETLLVLRALARRWTVGPAPGHTVRPAIRSVLVPDRLSVVLERRAG